MRTIYPPALQPGDTIGVMAPSSRVDRKVVNRGVGILKAHGYNVYVHPQTFARHEQSAGTVKEKIRALHDLYKNPKIKAIICARGGNRAGWLLEQIDYKMIAKNPKILLGYSDVTALLNAIHKETGQVTFHGPVVHDFGRGRLRKSHAAQCFKLLGGSKQIIPMGRSKTIHTGKAVGPLIGGNLSLICSLMGTPWQPNFKGAILFLEDCDEEISRYDRMLVQLHNAGVFRQIAGLITGGFTNTKDTGFLTFGFGLEDIIHQQTDGLKIPVVMNAPFGHGKNMFTYPLGQRARLTAGREDSMLSLDGPSVKG